MNAPPQIFTAFICPLDMAGYSEKDAMRRSLINREQSSETIVSGEEAKGSKTNAAARKGGGVVERTLLRRWCGYRD